MTDVVIIREPATTLQVVQEDITLSVASPGPQGSPGPPGPPGGARFELAFTAANPVVVNHNLDTYPHVTVVIGGQSVDVDVTFASRNQATITFASPQTGTVEMS